MKRAHKVLLAPRFGSFGAFLKILFGEEWKSFATQTLPYVFDDMREPSGDRQIYGAHQKCHFEDTAWDGDSGMKAR